MVIEHPNDRNTLKQRIEAMPEDSILFRSDFPEYHYEFVGSTLSELTNEGVLTKIAQGIYAKPRKSRFGIVLPTVDKVVQARQNLMNANGIEEKQKANGELTGALDKLMIVVENYPDLKSSQNLP